MAYVNGNKPIITNGLVYALDFGNLKSYTTGANTARSLVYDTAVTTVTGSSGLPTLVNGVLNITSSQFIRRTGSLDSIDPNGAFTISLVAKPNTVGSLLTQNLTGKVFQIQSTPSSSNIGFNLGTGTYSRTIPGFNSGSLQHISFRYNSGSIDTFLNGIPVTSSIANTSILPTGQLNALFFGSGSNSFSGSLANLYVYNRALSPDEIYENYLVMAGRYGLPVIPKPYSIDENLYQWIQATNTTDTNIISAISTFILGLKSTGLWNKIQTIYPFVGTTTGSQTINLKEPGLYRLGLTGSFSASSAGLSPSSSTAFVDSIPGNTVHPLVNSQSAHLSLLSYDLPTGNGFLGGNSARAVGGDLIISSGSRVYHAFLNTGTSSFYMTDPSITNVEVLVVAGGGGGGTYIAGGGGAGGLVYSSSFTITPNSNIPVIVGNGATARQGTNLSGFNGENSVFSTITAVGGGGGGTAFGGNGLPGGSGGGSGGGTNTGGTGTPGQGNDGGGSSGEAGGGGGGAGTAGQTATTGQGGAGGSGSYFPQYAGINLGFPAGWFAGGGGGRGIGLGGIGGGGTGASPVGGSGRANTGGGGGGTYTFASTTGGAGGSGIVIVSYDLPASALTGSGTGLYLTDSAITGSVNSQFTAGITGSGTIGFLTVSRTGSGVFSIHKNNVSQSIASASLGALSTDIFFNTANLAGSGSLPLPATLAYASIGAGLTTSEVSTYYNLVSQLQTNLKRQNTLLDNYSGAAAAYSLRRIGPSGYFGPAIRVRRDSDNTLRDIGFTSDGQLDTVGLLDFVGVTGSGFVQTWYDQSGNGRDATQGSTGAQPIVIISGSVVVENIKPALRFDGINDFLSNSNIPLSQPYGSFNVFGSYLNTNASVLTAPSSNNPYMLLNYQGYFQSSQAGYFPGNVFPIDRNQHSQYVLFNNTSSIFGFDNSEVLNQNGGITGGNGVLGIGATSNGTFPSAVKYQELVLYNTNFTTNRLNIQSNINSNYKIFGSATASFDPDYSAFITATGITQPTQSAALETLVSDLKSYGLWSKMKAIYPMVTDKNNRFAQSEDFSLTWNPVSSSVTVNQITAPNGTSTADLIREEAGTGDHYVYQTVDTLVSGNEYVLSVYGRFLNRPWIALQSNDGAQAWFNLQTGVTGSFTGSRVSITNVGSSWYRCALFYTASSNGAKNQHIHLADANGNYNYTGVATTGSYLWGAQFENGNLLGPYRATTTTGFTTGSMLEQMKFNLRNPVDTNAGFRLVYSGSWNPGYSSNKPDGAAVTYANTSMPFSTLSTASYHFSFYSTTNAINSNEYTLVGVGLDNRRFNVYNTNGYYANSGGDITVSGIGPFKAYHILNRPSSTFFNVFRNTAKVGTNNSAPPGSTSSTVYISNNSGLNFGPSPLGCGLVTIGDGLTDYQAKALYWIVQKFQTTLGRQVY
jgi:hypothetical protein